VPNTYFQFKQFRIDQENSGMKVTTDSCLFGAWVANDIVSKKKEPRKILDIGTGTGLLSLMLAQVTSNSKIVAIEINQESYQEALSNFSNSKWADRLSILHKSIQDINMKSSFDLIICNPPFFTNHLKGNHQDKNQAIHNESLPVELLAKKINLLLSKDGSAYIMYPTHEMSIFCQSLQNQDIYVHQKVGVKNQFEGKVFRKFLKVGFTNQPFYNSSISIRNPSGSYSNEFQKLLSHYYL